MEGFKALGLSYRNTPIEMREKVTFEQSEANHLLLQLKDMFAIEEALLISTCNRTELYYASAQNHAEEIVK